MRDSLIAHRLREILGAAGVRASPQSGEAHLIDATPIRTARAPAIVASPATAEQAGMVMAACSAEGWRVAFIGGDDVDHCPPADVIVNAARMRGVLEYEPADLTAHVAAGTSLAELRATLFRQRQLWPVDAPSPASATLGGAIASGRAGPSRFGTGSPRDHVLGLELVTGDGRSLVLGGRVVKNVAGYDLVRLVVGSRGTLGLVTRAHLRLRALPETDVTAMWFAPQPAPLLETAARAEHAWPTAIELLSPAVAHAAAGKVHWMLMVRCAGNTDFVKDATLRLLALTPDRVLAGDDAGAAWLALDRFEQRPAVAVRIGGPPASLAFLLDAAHELIRADAGRWRIAAHAANGIVRLWRPDPVDHDRAARLASAIDAGRRILLEGEGVIDLVEGEGLMPAGFDARVVSETERRLIDGIRLAFDPAGILSGPRPRPAV